MIRRARTAVGLALLASTLTVGCGDGHGPLNGAWSLTPYHDGIADDPLHLTIVQQHADLTALFTCRIDMPIGTGTYTHGDVSLDFDFGGGDVLSLDGHRVGGHYEGTFTSPEGDGTWRLDHAEGLDCDESCDPPFVEAFVGTEWTDLSTIEEISLFRSSAGHDYSDACEGCRSMKHYFAPYAGYLANGVVPVYAPVDGIVISVEAEGHGASVGLENKQVRIRSSDRPEYTFILFHVDVFAGIDVGDGVFAGTPIGTARLVYPDLAEVAHDFDLAVRLATPFGARYLSWFDVVTDDLFLDYVARGASARTDFVLTKAVRDADPLTCDEEAFTSAGSLPAWFVLDPP